MIWNIVLLLIYSYGVGGSIIDYFLPDEPKNYKDEIFMVNNQTCRIIYLNNIPNLLECSNTIIEDNRTIEYILTLRAKQVFQETAPIREEILDLILLFNASRYDETNPRYKFLGKVEEFACRTILGDGIIPINQPICQRDPYHCYTLYICRPEILDCDTRLFNSMKPIVTSFFVSSKGTDEIVANLTRILNGYISLDNYSSEISKIRSQISTLINYSNTMQNTTLRIGGRECPDCYNLCFPILHNTSALSIALNRTSRLEIPLLINLKDTISKIQTNTPIRMKIYSINQEINRISAPFQLALNRSLEIERMYSSITQNITFSNYTKVYNEYKNLRDMLRNKLSERNMSDFEYYLDRMLFFEDVFRNMSAKVEEIYSDVLMLEKSITDKYYLYIILNPADDQVAREFNDLKRLYTRPIDGDRLDEIINRTIRLRDKIESNYAQEQQGQIPSYAINIYWIYKNISRLGNFSVDMLRLLLAIVSSLLIPSFLFIIVYILKSILTDAKLLRYMFAAYIILIIFNFVYSYYTLIPTNVNIYEIYNTIRDHNGTYIIEDERLRDCLANRKFFRRVGDVCISGDSEVKCSDIETNSVVIRTTTDKSNILILGDPLYIIYLNINLDDMNKCSAILDELERSYEDRITTSS
ncbi:MAG: hypothetical protein QXM92_00975 [Candidatus Anstonellales archaeon]